MGASSALNMVGAVKAAEAIGKGNTVGEKWAKECHSFFRDIVFCRAGMMSG